MNVGMCQFEIKSTQKIAETLKNRKYCGWLE